MEAIRVKVRYFSFFQDIAGKAEEYLYLKKPSVKGLLELLEQRYQSEAGKRAFNLKSAKNRREFMIFVNGRQVADLKCPLKNNDEVSLLQPMGGG